MFRPFHFIVVVWGEKYFAELANFCIPSLLAPGNLPALRGNVRHKLVLVTTREDRDRLTQYPIMTRWLRYADIEWVEIGLPTLDESVYDHMNNGYKLGIQFAIDAKALGVLLTPDLLVSDGSLAAIEKRALAGARVVLTAALRYGAEPLFTKLGSMGLANRDSRLGEEGKPLSISGRELATAGVGALHSETLRFEWDATYFSPSFTGLPGACWWRIPDEDAIIVYTSSWAPLLIDYGAVGQHDTSAMDRWSIDGDYVFRNFGNDDSIQVVQDSDEAMIVSWTPMDFLGISLKPNILQTIPRFGEFFKGSLLRDAFLGPRSDPLKRRIFFKPVFFHGHDRNEKWDEVEARATDILTRYLLQELKGWRWAGMRMLGTSYRIYALVVGRWANRRRIVDMVFRGLKGEPAARNYLRHRIRLYFRQLIGKPVSDD